VISDSGFKGIGSPSWVAPTQGEAVGFGQSFAVAHFALAFGGDFRKIMSANCMNFPALPGFKGPPRAGFSRFWVVQTLCWRGSGVSRLTDERA
jgi:hypothetical protein